MMWLHCSAMLIYMLMLQAFICLKSVIKNIKYFDFLH